MHKLSFEKLWSLCSKMAILLVLPDGNDDRNEDNWRQFRGSHLYELLEFIALSIDEVAILVPFESVNGIQCVDDGTRQCSFDLHV